MFVLKGKNLHYLFYVSAMYATSCQLNTYTAIVLIAKALALFVQVTLCTTSSHETA